LYGSELGLCVPSGASCLAALGTNDTELRQTNKKHTQDKKLK